jgi:calcium-dependent protein kinase
VLGQIACGVLGTVLAVKTTQDSGDGASDKLVAFKQMLWKDEALLRREVRMLKTLSHPNIINVLDCFELETDGKPTGVGFTMPLLQGGDLRVKVQSVGPLSEAATLSVAAQCGAALAHIHERGFVHRDVKPENIVFSHSSGSCDDGHLCLVDFGLSTQVDDWHSMCVHRGSLGYVAPEVLARSLCTAKIDCFSLGASLYFCLRGRDAFGGKRLKDVLRANLRGEVQLSGSEWSTTSPKTLILLESLLKIDPSQRMQSAQIAEFIGEPKACTNASGESCDMPTWVAASPSFTAMPMNFGSRSDGSLMYRPACAEEQPCIPNQMALSRPTRKSVLKQASWLYY